ncbi:MAG: type II toxin-antitoxin system VapC family toxin [Spirulina sp.]
MKLLLDTHIWLWYTLGDDQLSDTLRSLIPQTDTELWVSPISLWEVMLLDEKGKIALSDDPAAWIEKSLDALQILEAPLTGEIAILSRQIDLPHQDPADRFIAATALRYGFQLATVDTHLTAAEWLSTIC